MIKIENTNVHNLARSIYSARNAMNSWDKSDSNFEKDIIGNNDLSLAKQLVRAGTDHSKFMRMINVSVDITAPLYWWKEADTYKIGTVRNSCSTMHKIHAKEFERNDFSHEHLVDDGVTLLDTIIDMLNQARDVYNHFEEYKRDNEIDSALDKKTVWWQMIQLLPSSYNQRATWQANYAVLRNIYHSRKNHKLDEWHDFCHWIESLPYSELITM